MDSKQFAWMYLLEHGQANAKPSYYGGFEFVDTKAPGKKGSMPFGGMSYNETFLEHARLVGINWSATKEPRSEWHSTFEGTFHDPGRKEYLEGYLVLNDGTKQFWCGDPPVHNVFQMMADIEKFKDKFKDFV